MKKKISVGAALGIAGITAVVVFFATSFAQLNMIGALTNNAWYQEPLYQKIHAIEQIVEKQFDGEIEEKQLMDYVSRGYMAGLGDRFSLYFSKEDLEEFLISEAGELVGIGVTGIQDPETGYIRVESVYKGSPADLAGLRAGDLLTAVDGTGVLEVGYEEAMRLGFSICSYYRNYQSLYGLHVDTEHLHLHFAVITVAYTDGKMYAEGLSDWHMLRGYIQGLLPKWYVDFRISGPAA